MKPAQPWAFPARRFSQLERVEREAAELVGLRISPLELEGTSVLGYQRVPTKAAQSKIRAMMERMREGAKQEWVEGELRKLEARKRRSNL